MKKSRILWLTRSTPYEGDSCWYTLWEKEPPIEDGVWAGGACVDSFCPKVWCSVTNIRLRKGQKCRVRFTYLKKGFKIEKI